MDEYEKRLRDATERLIALKDLSWSSKLPSDVAAAQKEWDEALEALKIDVYAHALIAENQREKDIRWGRNLEENLG